MNRPPFAAFAAVGFLGLVATSPAPAQYQYNRPVTSPYQRPVLSPYLQLFRSGEPGFNYYTATRPLQQLNTNVNSINLLQRQLASEQQDIAGLSDANATLITGHPVYFLNYQRYFLNTGAQTLGQRQAGTGLGQRGIGGRPGLRGGGYGRPLGRLSLGRPGGS